MRKLLSLLFVVLLIIPVTANAGDLPKIVDDADLLTDSQVSVLKETAQEIADTYQMDVVIVTVWTLDGKSPQDYADDYFDYQGYGIGADRSGILLLIAMGTREWYISTSGEAIYAITDYGVESLFEEMSWYLSDGEYYEAFSAYLSALPEYFDRYQSGDPIDGYAGDYQGPGSYSPGDQEEIVHYQDREGFGIGNLLISLAIGAAVGGLTLLIMSAKMNSRRQQTNASAYIKQGSYYLYKSHDRYLYSHVSKVPRAQSSSGGGSGGGSSVHRSSSGRRHGGGGGRF